MTTRIAKILAVVVTVLSIGFMGFAIAVYAGGKDWTSEVAASDLTSQYQIVNTGGENPTWNITRNFPSTAVDGKRALDASVGSEFGLPQALVKARTDMATQQRARITELDAEIAVAKPKVEQLATSRDRDIKALEARVAELTQIANTGDAQLKQLSAQLVSLMDNAAKIRGEAARRREDVGRLQNQLDLLRTDIYRLTELKRTLTDRLVQLKIGNESLRLRKAQLNSE